MKSFVAEVFFSDNKVLIVTNGPKPVVHWTDLRPEKAQPPYSGFSIKTSIENALDALKTFADDNAAVIEKVIVHSCEKWRKETNRVISTHKHMRGISAAGNILFFTVIRESRYSNISGEVNDRNLALIHEQRMNITSEDSEAPAVHKILNVRVLNAAEFAKSTIMTVTNDPAHKLAIVTFNQKRITAYEAELRGIERFLTATLYHFHAERTGEISSYNEIQIATRHSGIGGGFNKHIEGWAANNWTKDIQHMRLWQRIWRVLVGFKEFDVKVIVKQHVAALPDDDLLTRYMNGHVMPKEISTNELPATSDEIKELYEALEISVGESEIIGGLAVLGNELALKFTGMNDKSNDEVIALVRQYVDEFVLA